MNLVTRYRAACHNHLTDQNGAEDHQRDSGVLLIVCSFLPVDKVTESWRSGSTEKSTGKAACHDRSHQVNASMVL